MVPAIRRMARPRETREPGDEQLYRAHFLRSDARRSLVVIGVGLVANVAFVPNDLRLVAPGFGLHLLLAARLVDALIHVVAMVALLRSSSPRVHDRAVALFLASSVFMTAYVPSTRPPGFVAYGVVNILVVTSVYFVLAGPVVVRSVGAALVSSATLWLVLRGTAGTAEKTSLLLTHVFTQVIGLALVGRLESMRREGFFAHLDEQRARAELEIQRDRAETSAKARSDFLALMSHELRTPMHAVLGLSEVLGATPLSAAQRDLVRSIHGSAHSLFVVLADILELAALEAERTPGAHAPKVKPPPPTPRPSDPDHGSAVPWGLRVLVVDDSALNIEVALALLGMLGLGADVAASGKEALEAAQRKEYDLIFMDLRMPEMDGVEATRRLFAAIPPGRRPRVVALSANPGEQERAACREVGMSEFLHKPLRVGELRAALGRAKPGGVSPAPKEPAPAPAAQGPSARSKLDPEAIALLRSLATPESPGFLATVCGKFLSDVGPRLDRMASAAATGDAETAEREAHTLKTACATVGAWEMSAVCAALESAAQRDDLSTYSAAIEALRADLVEVGEALSQEVGAPLTAP